YIMQEQKMFQGETGNRNNLIQAYYMAVDHINNGRFSAKTFVSSGIANSTAFTRSISLFPNLQSYLLDYSHSDEQVIDEMVRVLSAETDDDKDTRYTEYFKQDDYDFNLRLGTLMKAYLNILNGNKK